MHSLVGMEPVSLSTELPELLSADAGAAAWRRQLDAHGLLEPVHRHPRLSRAVVDGIEGLHAALGALEQVERELAAARAANPLAGVKLPDLVWVLVGGALLFIVLFAEVAIAWLGDAAIWGGIALAVAVATWTVIERRISDPSIRPRLEQQRRALRAAVEHLVSQTFVVRLGTRVVVCTPQLDRLRGMTEALRAATPGSPLLGPMDADIARCQDAIDQLLDSDPEGWPSAVPAPDVEGWLRRIDASG